MAAVVQVYPQQTGTITMIQTQPTSTSGIMSGHSHSHSHSPSNSQYMANPQSHRNNMHTLPASPGGQSNYRGIAAAPIQPYAFTATPALNNAGQWQSYGALRTVSTPSVPTTQMMHYQASVSRDDSALQPTSSTPRQVAGGTGQPTFAQVVSGKATPERYRRPALRTVDSSPSQTSQQTSPNSGIVPTSGMATAVHLYNPRAVAVLSGNAPIPRNSATLASRPFSAYGYIPGASADDMMLQRHPTEEELKRYRRRSLHAFTSADYLNPMSLQEFKQQQQQLDAKRKSMPDIDQKSTARIVAVPGGLAEKDSHTGNGSSESLVSSRSSNSRPSSSTNRNSGASAPTASPPSTTTSTTDEKPSSADYPKLVNIPPRSSSSDAAKRVLHPSPLSKPATMASDSATANDVATPASNSAIAAPSKPPGSSHGSVADSPAAKKLAAINEKGSRAKSKTSRLRRAFSFGSAADFKKVADGAAEENKADSGHESGKLHKEPDADDLYEQEQARIARKQEASGLGNSIYSGTKIFSGSTDNLSISSTASSASIMLRKMGKGMKKGGRSLVGLFRPKSVIGTPISEVQAPEVSQAAVSMVTVEAERERVNVNSNADLTQQSGETGFPHLERNSIDAIDAGHNDSLKSDRLGSSGTDQSTARKSIVGSEKERAEVLGAIRKGILKSRSDSPSPSPRAQDNKGATFELPMIPNISDSPMSSAPSTPNEEAGQKRNGAVTIGNEDYFMSALKLRQDSKSTPGTPQGGAKRITTFSPRIVFHDTWPSQEYDRRGEIATCNRLTPMLAQQIKEELNTFKMEMEVHETSKIYTHFF
ncbi:hypothetical protein BX600DRAFT_509064 [Xylariales sp. PMI_506]|nr:hypothetical protein BX600DRAFT_509064 [Xylariales sp. PMI_506]